MIDARAVVSPRAELAADVEVGPYSVIGPDVVIGKGSWIGPHVVINGPTRIGADNRIFQFASIGDAPQDKKYRGEPTRLEIGDRNVIRECVTVHRGTTHDKGVTRMGSDNLLMAYCHVAHDCVLGNKIIMSNYTGLAGHVIVEDSVVVGAYGAVHQFCRLGAHAMLSACSKLVQDLPPYFIADGSPATLRAYNKVGLERSGFTAEQIDRVRQLYRLLIQIHAVNVTLQNHNF